MVWPFLTPIHHITWHHRWQRRAWRDAKINSTWERSPIRPCYFVCEFFFFAMCVIQRKNSLIAARLLHHMHTFNLESLVCRLLANPWRNLKLFRELFNLLKKPRIHLIDGRSRAWFHCRQSIFYCYNLSDLKLTRRSVCHRLFYFLVSTVFTRTQTHKTPWFAAPKRASSICQIFWWIRRGHNK